MVQIVVGRKLWEKDVDSGDVSFYFLQKSIQLCHILEICSSMPLGSLPY